MALMFLRSRSHVKESIVLTRADHLFIHNYIHYVFLKEIFFTILYSISVMSLSLALIKTTTSATYPTER